MYTAKYGDDYLHDPFSEYQQVEGLSISGGVNGVGSCTFNIAKKHPLFKALELRSLSKSVVVYESETIIFDGYVYDIEEGVDGVNTVLCESALGYLKDILLRPYASSPSEDDPPGMKYCGETADGIFSFYIEEYNSRADPSKQFVIGKNEGSSLTFNGPICRSSTQMPTVASELETKLLNSVGGYVFTRNEGGVRYIDYFSECIDVNSQIIDFGENLLDFVKKDSTEGMYTAIRPVGGVPEGEDWPINLNDFPDGPLGVTGFIKNGDVIYYEPAVKKYGRIEYAYESSNVVDVDVLINESIRVLKPLCSPIRSLEVKAIDVSLYKKGNKPLVPAQLVRVRSTPNDYDSYMLITDMDLDATNPENTVYTFGVTYDSLTGSQNKKIIELNSGINKSLDTVSALDPKVKDAAKNAEEAKDAADKAIIKTDLEFYQSDSSSELVGGVWESSNLWVDGKYTWERSKVYYGDGSIAYTPSETGVCVSGNTGATGADGRGVSKIDTTYQLGSSATTAPTGTWSTTPMAATDALPYLWTKNVATYTTGSPATNTFYSVSPKGTIGDTGPKGDPGATGIAGTPGADGRTPYLHIAYANSADGSSGFSTTDSVNKSYIGTYSDFAEADPTTPSLYSWTKTKGEQGNTGATGADGRGVSKIDTTYQLGSSATTAPTGTWSTTPMAATDDLPYLWTKNVATYTTGSPATNTFYSVSPKGTIGDTGTAGKDGQMLYATSGTAGETVAKIATLVSGSLSLKAGVTVSVTFTNANKATAPTLNVNGTGEKPILTNGTANAYWANGATVIFIYSGTYWYVGIAPVYANTATIGNPTGGNVYVDSTVLQFRDSDTVLAEMTENKISLAKNSENAEVSFCADKGSLSLDEKGRFSLSSKTNALLVSGTETVYEVATGATAGPGRVPTSHSTMTTNFLQDFGNGAAIELAASGDKTSIDVSSLVLFSPNSDNGTVLDKSSFLIFAKDVYINRVKLADFVIESGRVTSANGGESSITFYEKWNSGKLVLDIYRRFSSSLNSPAGYVGCGFTMANLGLPAGIEFVDMPIVTGGCGATGQATAYPCYIGTNTFGADAYMYKPSSGTAYWSFFHCVGLWK